MSVNPLFTRRGEELVIPRDQLPDFEMFPETAYQIVHDEVMRDGNARFNLATFVTTWMDPYADRLYAETFDKNMIDKDEYPQTAAIESRCVAILADLWHAPDAPHAVGTSTVGSSEACMLAGLALKRRWQSGRTGKGRPNLVMSTAVQVVWEKFCDYWEVEPRLVPVSTERPAFDGHALPSYVDENTIGVVAVLGVTYTGIYEPVADIARILDDIEQRTGLDIPIHVDAASGGMVAPFLQPDLVWDFRLDRVHSISTSGHKYGLVYPGIGWLVWRRPEYLPDDLVFRVSYLGGEMPTFALNFSRPGAQVLLQYYTFLRLGRTGFYAVQNACREVATHLAHGIGDLPDFELLSDGSDIPVFAWRQAPGHTGKWTLYDLSDRLRTRGWLVPAYPLPEDLQDVTVQRIVVRNGLSMDLASGLLDDVRAEVHWLNQLSAPMPREAVTPGFHH